MNSLWKKKYTLRANDFDKYNHIKPSAVLELFQDAAGQHAIEIGVGFDAMIRRSYLWVLTRIKFKIISEPKSYQNVIIKTWPLVPGRLIHRREYCIESENGERLIVGSSEWVVVHSEKRRPVSDTTLYNFPDFHTELMFEEKLSKAPDFTATGVPRIVSAGFSELDANNHVNNTKYANYVLDAVVPNETDTLRTFQIDYRKEVLEGTQLRIYHTRDGNDIAAKGLDENGDTMFVCHMEFNQ